jgi:hypothetical protein
LCIGGFYLACDFRDELGRQMKRDNALKLAAKLLGWHTYNADCISESEIDETLRLSAIALREQADLIRQLETDIIKIEKVSDFNADRVNELEKGTALACQLYGHTNFDVEYDGFTFLRCSVCGVNKDDQND